MILLLDENIPRKLKYSFSSDLEILRVQELGWDGKKNGDLLKSMQEKGLEILLSIDKNFSHQQNLERYNICLIVPDARDTRLPSLLEYVPLIETYLKEQSLTSGLHIITLPE